MSRIAWALVLALVVHLLFFRIQMPEQEEAQLILAGSDHVSVRLAHFRREEVDKVVPEAEPDPALAVEPEPEKVEAAEISEEAVVPPVQKPVETISTKNIKETEDVQEKEEKAVTVIKEQIVVLETAPTVNEKKQRIMEVVPVSAADGPESAGSTNPITQAIGQAEPLTAVNRPPVYPTLARRRGWQGTVVLDVDVDREGLVMAVRIQTSSSYSLLDREAQAAVRKWRFTPGSRNGEPIPSKVLVPVHFMLQDN